jgi:hypothetical protein
MRIVKFVFACLAVFGSLAFIGGCQVFEDEKKDKPLRVLMIGNSFSVCVLQHAPAVAADMGLRLDIASLYIGGCSLERHWQNVLKDSKKDFAPYSYVRNCEGKITRSKSNVCEALRSEQWDVVTLQQVSSLSWRKESYHPFGDNLVAKIRALAPGAKIYIQETWSYTPWDTRLKKWGIDQDEMYEKLRGAYADFASRHSLEIIRMGTAVQQWRKRLKVKYTENSLGGDVVGGGRQAERDQFKRTLENKWVPNCDVFHLGRSGEYLQALVWTAKLFDVDVEKCKYRPQFVSQEHSELMKKIASELK